MKSSLLNCWVVISWTYLRNGPIRTGSGSRKRWRCHCFDKNTSSIWSIKVPSSNFFDNAVVSFFCVASHLATTQWQTEVQRKPASTTLQSPLSGTYTKLHSLNGGKVMFEDIESIALRAKIFWKLWSSKQASELAPKILVLGVQRDRVLAREVGNTRS